ncbi:glycosyltransferase family A protein [Sporomusa malonica]|uniref:Glycosyltransferase involved in cell wall bisynthesis n=1 Tax=Sporomusa malonica TaxID=112901 RepID=A0A1W2EUZ2_9FIRM|nr:glycosyltransferase family 2 protein [Sporomusa malonica]SMD13465.1 Glycosyltransferase involved in cell wall bisynthesis [Sporomusa malonica]
MESRATVIIPTFGDAKFACWAIKSVQEQTIKDIEICIICDGSPENMVALFKNIAKEDVRIKVFTYPKSPRTGEPYRDAVIKQTTGKIICYCSHDDLWLPNHVQELEKTLHTCWFTHSIHAVVNMPDKENTACAEPLAKAESRLCPSGNIALIQAESYSGSSLFSHIYWADLQDPIIIDKMLNGRNFFGLTYGAHTRESYVNLEEGWITTPVKNIPTDLYMWCKFLSGYKERCKTTMKITALSFPKLYRKEWSEQQRDDELKLYFEKILDPSFLKRIDNIS